MLDCAIGVRSLGDLRLSRRARRGAARHGVAGRGMARIAIILSLRGLAGLGRAGAAWRGLAGHGMGNWEFHTGTPVALIRQKRLKAVNHWLPVAKIPCSFLTIFDQFLPQNIVGHNPVGRLCQCRCIAPFHNK